MMTNGKPGKNVNRLIATRMSVIAIPDGTKDTRNDVIKFLSSATAISRAAREASAWVNQAIEAVRMAADPNPWRNSDDEAIAGEILRLIDERKVLKHDER